MSKISTKSVRLPKSGQQVNLSNRSTKVTKNENIIQEGDNCTSTSTKKSGYYIHIKHNQLLNEVRFSLQYEKASKPKKKRPEKIVQKSLDRRGSKRIKDACKLLCEGKATMITLTYPEGCYPDDLTAKKQVDNFLKSVRGYVGTFNYVWVQEKTKKGVPHFHLITRQFVPMDKVNKWWTNQYNKWLVSEGQDKVDYVITRTEAVRNGKCSNYVTKNGNKYKRVGRYLTKTANPSNNYGHTIEGKMYGMDNITSKMIKFDKLVIATPYKKPAVELIDTVFEEAKGMGMYNFKWTDKNDNPCGVIYSKAILNYVHILIKKEQIEDLRIHLEDCKRINPIEPKQQVSKSILQVA